MRRFHVCVKFEEELLGTASANPELHSQFIASKAPDAPSREEEIEALGVDEVVEKSKTVFPKMEDGTPFTWDYQWKGFFKESCKMLKGFCPGSESSKVRKNRQELDGALFVQPRKIPLVLPDGAKIGNCQRPLRSDMRGTSIVALANSETVPAGTTQEFDVVLLSDNLVNALPEWLEYGALHGFGQWRNSGKGRFTFEISEVVADHKQIAPGVLAAMA
jgi:hypothetical protein